MQTRPDPGEVWYAPAEPVRQTDCQLAHLAAQHLALPLTAQERLWLEKAVADYAAHGHMPLAARAWVEGVVQRATETLPLSQEEVSMDITILSHRGRHIKSVAPKDVTGYSEGLTLRHHMEQGLGEIDLDRTELQALLRALPGELLQEALVEKEAGAHG